MIFFNVPSVGQLKPETLFGQEDHYGFIQTLTGEKYSRDSIRAKCATYYDTKNDRYWDQIITLINFLAIKRLDNDEQFSPIPILDFMSEEYDNSNPVPAKLLFDYLLCQWQYPHPIVTKNGNSTQLGISITNPRLNYPSVKPYPVILAILRNLYKINPRQAFLTNEEFYWIGFNFFKNAGKNFTVKDADNLTHDILKIRSEGGWPKYKDIESRPETSTHLSYPKGFLRNSCALTTEESHFDARGNLFIGLKPSISAALVDTLIESSKDIFEFDRSRPLDTELAYAYSSYLYDPTRISKWAQSTDAYKLYSGIFGKVESIPEKPAPSEKSNYKINILLSRLSSVDKKSVRTHRAEQHLLRNYLFGGCDSGSCAICNEKFPLRFLATAHIKKRSHCSDSEKRDINVVMPACHMGCDKLFEEGYIYVDTGLIRGNLKKKQTTDAITRYVSKIEGKKCSFYTASTSKYFQHHEKQNV